MLIFYMYVFVFLLNIFSPIIKTNKILSLEIFFQKMLLSRYYNNFYRYYFNYKIVDRNCLRFKSLFYFFKIKNCNFFFKIFRPSGFHYFIFKKLKFFFLYLKNS